MASVNSRHDLNSEHMERIIVHILSRLDLPLFNSMRMDTDIGQDAGLDCLQFYLKGKPRCSEQGIIHDHWLK